MGYTQTSNRHSMRLFQLCTLFVAALCMGVATAASDVLLAPSNNTALRDHICILWIQGEGLTAESYRTVAEQTQKEAAKLGIAVWVGIPEATSSVPSPFSVPNGINRTYNALVESGMPADVKVYGAAHSVGTVFLQMYIHDHMNTSYDGAVSPSPNDYKVFNMHAAKIKFEGVIVMGGFILRQYNATWKLPVMHIAGEVDGMCRITRVAQNVELHFNKRGGMKSPTAVRDFPHVVVQGGSHMQFSSGEPTLLIKERDLKPFVSEETAHQQIGSFIANFLSSKTKGLPSALLTKFVKDAYANYWSPLLMSLEEEGHSGIKPPCNCNNPKKDPYFNDPYFGGWVNLYPCLPGTYTPGECWPESPWASKMHSEMVGLPHVKTESTTAFHPVSQTHPSSNLPYVFNNCTSPSAACTLRITGVAQNNYAIDPLDTGFLLQSAREIRSKQLSRQRLQIAAGVPAHNVWFNETDETGLNACASLNAKALDWAKKHAGKVALERYNSIGQEMVMGNDIKTLGGPSWIDNELEFTKKGNQMIVSSPSLSEPYPFLIHQIEGVHYCKLLSPARALEWILLDSLREHHGLGAS